MTRVDRPQSLSRRQIKDIIKLVVVERGHKIKKIVPNKLYLVLVFHPKRLILHLIGGAATKSSATSHVWGLPRAER
jgi:hypothetical protein